MTHADPTLTIDLSAIAHNWRVIRDHASSANCAAVVKANAYGLGVEQVAPALEAAGCSEFFVATLDEAIALRAMLPQARIYLFNGIRDGQEPVLIEHNIIPVLNTLSGVFRWNEGAKNLNQKLPAILHIDSGMNRLGLTTWEAAVLADNYARRTQIDWCYIMSHLACSSTPDHSMNEEQLDSFHAAAKPFGDVPLSIANSTAALGPKRYHLQLVRPGIHLYGSRAPFAEEHDLKHVITLTAPVIQLRTLDTPGAVGYGATYAVNPGSRIAIVPVGYADGYLRSASGRGQVAYDGKLLPLAGRVSMDLIAVDVTDAPEIGLGTELELIGETLPVDTVAQQAGTIAYEILTGLGSRYNRIYTN